MPTDATAGGEEGRTDFPRCGGEPSWRNGGPLAGGLQKGLRGSSLSVRRVFPPLALGHPPGPPLCAQALATLGGLG